jgi:hypothetical protein
MSKLLASKVNLFSHNYKEEMEVKYVRDIDQQALQRRQARWIPQIRRWTQISSGFWNQLSPAMPLGLRMPPGFGFTRGKKIGSQIRLEKRF